MASFVLTFLRDCRVVVKSMTHSSGSWQSTSTASLFLSSRDRCSLTDTNKSFILLASSSTFPSVALFARFCMFDLSVVFYPLFFHISPPSLASRFMHCFNACMVELKFLFRCCSVNFIAQRPGFNYVSSHMDLIWARCLFRINNLCPSVIQGM